MYTNFKTIAIIPARGGSKGIPRKNLLQLYGKPLVGRTIETAKQSCYIDKVVISTDDLEIANVSKQHGAEIAWRPEDISGDLVSSELALLNTLEQYPNYDELVFLQCTSPLTLPEDINKIVEQRRSTQSDTAFSASESHHFLWKYDKSGNAVGINHDKRVRVMRQEWEKAYYENGAVYAMDVNGFIEHRHRFFGKTTIYVMPTERSLDIDSLNDLLIAETILKDEND